MIKIRGSFNKYLIAIFTALIVVVSMFVAGLNGLWKGVLAADDTGNTEITGSWLDYFHGYTCELSNGSAPNVKISSEQDLAWLCLVLIKATEPMFENTTFWFTKEEYDMSGHYWTPLGTENNPFRGRFKIDTSLGQSFSKVKIKNLTIDNTNDPYCSAYNVNSFGFFGVVDNCVESDQGFISCIEVENLNMNIDTSKVTQNDAYVGGVVGYYAGRSQADSGSLNDAGLYDCLASGTINVDINNATSQKNVHVGGTCGYIKSGSKASYNLGGTSNITIEVGTNTSSTYYVGGVVGTVDGSLTGISSNVQGDDFDTSKLVVNSLVSSGVGNLGLVAGQVTSNGLIEEMITSSNAKLEFRENNNSNVYGGGIVGLNQGTIKYCDNYGEVVTYIEKFGGIAGRNSGQIVGCINSGNLIVDGDKALANSTSYDSHEVYLGGIVGENQTTGEIQDCTNNGEILGQNFNIVTGRFGGISANNKGAIYNSVNNANLGINLRAEYIGGIAGENEGIISSWNGDEKNKFTANFGNIVGNRYVGGIAGALGSSENNAVDYSITKCYNKGSLLGNDLQYSYVGGITGLVQNCGVNTIIDSCMNLGAVGDLNNSAYSGGIVGRINAPFTLSNCANYADVMSTSYTGGLVAIMDSSVMPTFTQCVSTGKVGVSSIDKLGQLGGLIGYCNTNAGDILNELNSCVFDLGVAGYDLPYSFIYGYTPGIISRIRVVGNIDNKSQWTMANAPLTYNLTSPGVDEVRSYYSYKIFSDTTNWYFEGMESTASHEVHYYPVPRVFWEKGIFGDTVSNPDAIARIPSQNLVKVTLTNYMPDFWDTNINGISYCNTYINIYPDLVLEGTLNNLKNGQYVIEGQKIATPTGENHNREDYNNGGDYSAFYTEQNSDGLLGRYWTHPGYNAKFVLDNPTSSITFNFDSAIYTSTNIFITHTPKTYAVSVYVYNDSTNLYENSNNLFVEQYGYEPTLTYSMEPGSTANIPILKQDGRSFWGWRLDDTLNRADYPDEESWINAWSTGITNIPCDVVYQDEVRLYCMFTALKITLTLHAGFVNDATMGLVEGYFPNRSGSRQYQVVVEYGKEIQLDIPAIDISGYNFRGYYTQADGGQIKVDRDGLYLSYLNENTEFFAHWVYTIQKIDYVSITDTGGFVPLLTVNANFDDTIDITDQLTAQTAAAKGIDYTMVDSTADPAGYSFGGCFADTALSIPFDFEAPILDNTTIYVKWDVKSFTLKLNANIGTNPDGELRQGGWGNTNDKVLVLSVPYRTDLLTYLRDLRVNNFELYTVSVEGFTANKRVDQSYYWTVEAFPMGENFEDSKLLSVENGNYLMPANNDLELFITWSRDSQTLTLNANGGYFPTDNVTTKSFSLYYEYNIQEKIDELSNGGILEVPLKTGWAFKYWSLTPDGSPMPSDTLMGLGCTLYAVYGEQRTITFYVIGARPENIVGKLVVFDGATVGNGLDMTEINQKINDFLKGGDPDAVSAFELDYWVEMTFDDRYNIVESSQRFDFEDRVINSDINLLAKLKPNSNYVAPVQDTTNYILIAGIVIVVSLVLLFVVLLTRPNKEKLSDNRKTKNKDIQAQLEEIRELERRRHDMDRPYDD